MKKHKVQFGSVSSGTVRPEDLIPAFVDELRWLQGRVPRDIYKELRAYEAGKLDEEDADWLLEALFDALDALAPAYAYFGAHEGDGADYGFWLISDFERCAQENDALFVDDTSKVPKDYSGEVVHINDHGNCTLYAARRGKLHEVWAVV